jgi:hypothetical protein
MKIRELFVKPIDRPINGVIKADQKDAESVWQELDEYVVTKQLTEYLRKFFDAYLATVDQPNDPVITARMGVWVSGFFGSGKSHFIKILSYLLSNFDARPISPRLLAVVAIRTRVSVSGDSVGGESSSSWPRVARSWVSWGCAPSVETLSAVVFILQRAVWARSQRDMSL